MNNKNKLVESNVLTEQEVSVEEQDKIYKSLLTKQLIQVDRESTIAWLLNLAN